MNYDQCLVEIEQLESRGIHHGLDTIQKACAILGHPERAYPTVQIAGTNGKGSTASFLSSILTCAGYKTGMTISPHIVSIRERIQVSGIPISKEDFVACHLALQKKVGHLSLTYFEWITLMAFTHFAEVKTDIAILETGLGGRWDATTIAHPVVGAITNISLDHQAILGDTPAKILDEKMQILKSGMRAATGIDDPLLLLQLKKHCEKIAVPLQVVTSADCKSLKTGLAGAHQKLNAGLALALVDELLKNGFKISGEDKSRGLSGATWPGRLETIGDSPRVLLDGAHNPAGIEALTTYLREQNLKVHLVFAALNDRPAEAMLKSLIPFARTITLAKLDGPRVLSDSELGHLQSLCEESANILEISTEKWQCFALAVPKDQTVLVTGSLTLISKVRALLKGEQP